MAIFRRRNRISKLSAEREIPEPDWADLGDLLGTTEERLGACKGWSIVGDTDKQCAVYLTSAAVYVYFHPEFIISDDTVVMPLGSIVRCEVAENDQGLPRLVVMSDTIGNSDPSDVCVAGIDLKPAADGWAFGEIVTNQIQVIALQQKYALLRSEPAPLLAELEEMVAVEQALADLGSAPDPLLNAQIKADRGGPDYFGD